MKAEYSLKQLVAMYLIVAFSFSFFTGMVIYNYLKDRQWKCECKLIADPKPKDPL